MTASNPYMQMDVAHLLSIVRTGHQEFTDLRDALTAELADAMSARLGLTPAFSGDDLNERSFVGWWASADAITCGEGERVVDGDRELPTISGERARLVSAFLVKWEGDAEDDEGVGPDIRETLAQQGQRAKELGDARDAAMEQLRRIILAANAGGVSVSEIARLAGVSRPTVYAALEDAVRITPTQIDAVLDRVTSTGNKGASVDQLRAFVVDVCDIAGSGLGPDAPWNARTVKAAVAEVVAEAKKRGFRQWEERPGFPSRIAAP